MRSTTFPPSPLRGYRAGQGFSQAELARVAGLSRETISRLEQGATPRLATAHALAAALGAPIGVIFPIQDGSPAYVPGSVNSSAGQGRHGAG
jgi:transcriptional regulator with XRE-family HTH domain